MKGKAAMSRSMSAMMDEGGRVFWDKGKVLADIFN